MKKITIIFLLGVFLAPQFAFAGAWTLPKGNVWIEWAMKATWAKDSFDDNVRIEQVDLPNDARSWGWSLLPKMEYGLTDRLTLLAGLEYKDARYKEYAPGTSWSVKHHAVTNVDFGARYRILENPLIMSVQIKGSIYTGYVQGPLEDSPTFLDRSEAPGLSDRDNSLELRLLLSKKYDTKVPWYWGIESGYRWRNRDVANDVPFFAEVGFWPIDWMLVKTEIDGFWTHEETGKIDKQYAIWRVGPVFQFFGGDAEVTKAGKGFDIGIFYGVMLWGENTDAIQEVTLKASTQF